MTTRQLIEKYFNTDCVRDVFGEVYECLDAPAGLSDYDLEMIIRDCRNLLTRYLYQFAFLTETYKTTDKDYQEVILIAVHESMFHLAQSYYWNIKTLITKYVEEHESPESFWPVAVQQKGLDADDIKSLKLVVNHGIFDIVSALDTRKLKIRINLDGESSFDIYDADLNRGIELSTLTLNDNGFIDSKKYFFSELMLMVHCIESVLKTFAVDNGEKDPGFSSQLARQRIDFPGIDIVVNYALEYLLHAESYVG